MPRPDDLPHLNLPGGYQAHRFLGRGAFGEVYEAEAPGGVAVAVKIIPRTLRPKEAEREEEALKVIKGLRHPYLLPLHAFFSLPERLVIVLELADGSLGQRLEQCLGADQVGIPAAELLGYLRETAEALDYLHQRNVQHRDIKPDNLLLIQGHIKVSDYGLARTLEKYSLQTATSVGTPAYMAPEVWGGKVSPNSDQYSLAITYLKLRVDRFPFHTDSFGQLMLAHMSEPPNLEDENLGEEEAERIAAGLAKDPRDRYPSCSAFVAALTGAPVKEPVLPPTAARRAEPPARTGIVEEGTSWATVVPQTANEPPPPSSHTVTKSSGLQATLGEEGAAAPGTRGGQPPQETAMAPSVRREWRGPQRRRWGCGLVAVAVTCIVLAGLGLVAGKLLSPTSDGNHSTASGSELALSTDSRMVPATGTESGTGPGRGAEGTPATGPGLHTGSAPIQTPVPSMPQTLELDLGGNVKLVMKRIPAKGKTFWMGSPDDEAKKDKESWRKIQPQYTEVQHQVTFGHDYYLGTFKVTQAQYHAVMGKQDPPSCFSKGGRGWDWVKGLNTDEFPVENVSWDDAKKFCAALNERFQGRDYQFGLPTEAQWEYACRIGDPSKENYPFYLKSGPSKSLSGGQVNFDGNYPFGDGIKGKNLQRTSRCGDLAQFPEAVNAFGLYDMHGNVWEWCADYYSPKYYQAGVGHVTQGETFCDKEDPEFKDRRVVRGGSWLNNAWNCRAAYRVGLAPGYRNNYVGFRVLLASPQD